MGKRTPFYDSHLKAQAKLVDFAGWEMPLHYGSQIQEHHQVRQQVGMFDVSHMGVVDLRGEQVAPFLRYLVANNIDKLIPGKALYTCMLNYEGGVLDDLIVYKVDDYFYRLVINAGTRDKDLDWIRAQAAPFSVDIIERTDLAMLAIQGPEAKVKLGAILPPQQAVMIKELKPFHFSMIGEWFIAHTGYTGEEGFEVIFPATQAMMFWDVLLSQGVKPCGLGARDTLRLEAGLNLYGADMDESVTPLESNLAWTVSFDPADRRFIGREGLEKQREVGVGRRLIGLVLEGPGIIRNHQKVHLSVGEGVVTSGGYSPTLEKSIALARLPVGDDVDGACFVEIRQKQIPARIIQLPFVRQGKKRI